MPGVFCNGVDTDQPYVSESRAYCEGMLYRAGGTALQRPITDNPHAVASDPIDNANWDRGWTLADDNAGGTISKADAGCCAARGLAVSA